MTSEQRRRIDELEKDNRELRRANEILKSAPAFFAAYADIGISRCRAQDHAEADNLPQAEFERRWWEQAEAKVA